MATTTYGSDFAGYTDIDSQLTIRETPEDQLLALAESIARRLATPRGALWYSPNDGYDLMALVGSTEDPNQASDKIESECRKDERIRRAKCDIAVVDRESWEVTVTCTPKSVDTTFTLVLAVSKVTVQLLKVVTS